MIPPPTAPPPQGPLERKLRARVARLYQTITEDRVVGGISLRFTRVADPDKVLDEVAEREDLRERLQGSRTPAEELHLPYWAELWDSASGVAQYLARRRAAGHVLDLGCGMGLAGAVAAALGCRVLLADLEPHALLLARLNTLPWSDRARVRRLDWRRDQLRERFDLILGADVLYERPQWEFLEPFWRAHLRHGGRVILGEPGRQTGDLFPNWIAPRGWHLRHDEEPVTTRPRPIRIFELSM